MNNHIELIWVPIQTIHDNKNITELTGFLSSHSFIQNSFQKLFPWLQWTLNQTFFDTYLPTYILRFEDFHMISQYSLWFHSYSWNGWCWFSTAKLSWITSQTRTHKSGIMFLKEQTPTLLLDQCNVTWARGRNILYFWILMLDISFLCIGFSNS